MWPEVKSLVIGTLLAHLSTTCLCTRLESLAWSHQGFWLPSFCRKLYLWSLCCDAGTSVELFCITGLEEGESVDNLGSMDLSTLCFSSRQLRHISPTPLHWFLHHNKGFINLQFMQNMSCQTPCWDQARLSSLVNKQVKLLLTSSVATLNTAAPPQFDHRHNRL